MMLLLPGLVGSSPVPASSPSQQARSSRMPVALLVGALAAAPSSSSSSSNAKTTQRTRDDALLRKLRKQAAAKQAVAVRSSLELETISTALRTLGLVEHTNELAGNRALLPFAQNVDLLLKERVALSDMEILLTKRAFLSASPDALAATFHLLKSTLSSHANVGTVLARNSGVLSQPILHLEMKLHCLCRFQVGEEARARICTDSHSILVMKEESLESKLAFFQDLGLSIETRDKLLCRFPQILRLSVDRSFQPTVDFLESRGVDKATMLKLLCSRPQAFAMSIPENLSKKFDMLTQIGLAPQESCRAMSFLCQTSVQRILTLHDALRRQGFSDVDIAKIIRKHPEIFGMSEDSLNKKLAFLVKVENRTLHEIVKFPACLSYSLEQRIIPRFNILRDRDLLNKYSLSRILTLDSEQFRKHFLIST